MKKICCVAVRVNGSILLLERSATDSSHPLHWNLPGGHAEKGERPRDAAARELGEEAGIWVNPGRLRLYGVQAPNLHTLVIYYTLDLMAFPKVSLNFEHRRFIWYNDHNRVSSPLVPLLYSMLSRLSSEVPQSQSQGEQ